MKIGNFFILFFSILLISCGSPKGKKIDIDNLEVYYTEDSYKAYAEKIGVFFKENGLIHPTKKHSIKLTSTPKSYVLNMILTDSLNAVSDKNMLEIEKLELALDTTVFKNLNFVIEITDAYFNPLIN